MTTETKTYGERVDAGEPLCEAYVAMMEFATARGATPIRDKLWTADVDARWRITVNGFREPKELAAGATLHPLDVYVEYNGWPAGIFGLFEGVIAAGEGANENTFIAALRAASVPS